jgi:hypothetical protein
MGDRALRATAAARRFSANRYFRPAAPATRTCAGCSNARCSRAGAGRGRRGRAGLGRDDDRRPRQGNRARALLRERGSARARRAAGMVARDIGQANSGNGPRSLAVQNARNWRARRGNTHAAPMRSGPVSAPRHWGLAPDEQHRISDRRRRAPGISARCRAVRRQLCADREAVACRRIAGNAHSV